MEKGLESVFLLMYFCGFSYTDARKLGLRQREWFINRLRKELSKSEGSRTVQDNTPEVRQLRGMDRSTVPANQRRFT